MSIALDEALLGWLIASAGDGLARRLRGDPTQVGLRRVVEAAVTATVAEVAADLGGDSAEHLCSSLLVRDVGLGGNQPPVSTEVELREAVHSWTAALDEAPFGGSGYLTGLGVDPQRLAGRLADHIVAGIHRDARGGGVLDGLAGWLWRDEATARLARIEDKIDAVGSANPTAAALPGGTPDFTGRQEVLDELARRAHRHDPDGTVVAIHAVDGMAGVGKTEFAVRAGHEHKHRYPDGQYFLDLHGYTEGIAPTQPAAALEELLRQAGVPGPAIPPDLAGRRARWRSLMAKQQALVLLDNALDADQVRPLLPGSAGCLVLITSRTRLRGLPGIKSLRLDVLPRTEAVELFTRLVDTDRPLDPQAVTTVVDLVGRLPIAVQAAAGLVDDSYTEADLANELAAAKSGIGLLDRASPLDTGVRAAFDTSLRRLDPPHRRAFRMLGVHPGPSIGVPQFAALADLPVASAHAMLRGLADRNLIKAAGSQVGHQRYQLHDLMRAFTRGQSTSHLTEQEQTAAIDRLTTWYATAMTTIERLRTTGSDPAEPGAAGLDLDESSAVHQWIAAEQENLRAYAKTATGRPAAAACHHAARNLYDLGFLPTAQSLLDTAAAGYRQAGDRAGEADAQRGLGYVARLTGDYQHANEHYRAAQRMCRNLGNRAGEASARHGLGDVARLTGDYESAAEHYRAAQLICSEIGNRDVEADARQGLGDVALLTGDYQDAAEHYRAAQLICSEIGNRAGQAEARRGLGDIARQTGDYQSAAEHYRAVQRICGEIGNWAVEANTRRGMGEVARLTGDYENAAEHYRAAQRMCSEMGNRAGEANARRGFGGIALSTGDYQSAAEHFHAAWITFTEIGNRRGQANARQNLGDVARLTGDHQGAADHFHAALTTFTQIGNQTGQADARRGLGDIARQTGDYQSAAEHYHSALTTFTKIGNRTGQAEALLGTGHIAKAQGRPKEAREQWGKALEILETIGAPSIAVRDLLEQLGRT